MKYMEQELIAIPFNGGKVDALYYNTNKVIFMIINNRLFAEIARY